MLPCAAQELWQDAVFPGYGIPGDARGPLHGESIKNGSCFTVLLLVLTWSDFNLKLNLGFHKLFHLLVGLFQ